MLEFEPVFKNFTFNGKEIITVNCKEHVNIIPLKCEEKKKKSCNVKHNGISEKAITKLDAKKEELAIIIKNKIKGTAFVEIEFTGELNDRLLGFYRSQYKQNGKTKYLATSQF